MSFCMTKIGLLLPYWYKISIPPLPRSSFILFIIKACNLFNAVLVQPLPNEDQRRRVGHPLGGAYSYEGVPGLSVRQFLKIGFIL